MTWNGITADQLTGAQWRKAAASNPNGNCVELAPVDGGVAMRNSRYPTGPVLVFPTAEFRTFLTGASAGEFNDLTGT
jgi:Domain of unknown function (DUF397)